MTADYTKVFQDVAAYTTAIYGAQHVRQATALACRTALAERGVAHLAFPACEPDAGMCCVERGKRKRGHPLI